MGERYWANTGIERIEGKEGRSRVPGILVGRCALVAPYLGGGVG